MRENDNMIDQGGTMILGMDNRMASLERKGQAVSRTLQNKLENLRVQAWRNVTAGKQPEEIFQEADEDQAPFRGSGDGGLA